MPTHIHIILEQLEDKGISKYMNLVLKSYSKYFNVKYNRRGPLWEGRFKNVSVETDEQFMHLTRYIHLNPTSSLLVDNPEDWEFSSYKEYAGILAEDKYMCDYYNFLDMDKAAYQAFVKDHVGYQRELEKIKHLLME
jgi:putative transposase